MALKMHRQIRALQMLGQPLPAVIRPTDANHIPESKPRQHVQRMLNEGLLSDAVIVASDGEKIKCHKFILTSQSDVFEAMFRETSKSKESLTGTVHMDDMCAKSVKAFLTFLYLDDIEKAKEDSEVALEVLKAAHKYHLPSLEKQMKKIFLQNSTKNWLNVEVAMQIYFHVKNLDDSEPLMRKALEIMKSNFSELNKLPAYIRLFEEEPKAARELCADLLSMQMDVELSSPFTGVICQSLVH